jgi:hypothetical protein
LAGKPANLVGALPQTPEFGLERRRDFSSFQVASLFFFWLPIIQSKFQA